MTVSPLEMSSVTLASHVIKVFGLIHRIAYAFIRPDLRIHRASDNFGAVISEPGSPYLNQLLPEVFWEFASLERELEAVLQGKSPYLAFERVNRRRPDGQIVYLDLSVTLIADYELGNGLLLIAEDVTHAAEAEQRLTQNRNELALAKEQLARANQSLQRLDRLKTLFLSMAAHDLRSPLTVIRAYSDLAQQVLAPDSIDKVQGYLRLIASQSSHMDCLVSDFLDLEQMEQGTLRLQRAETDLNQLVQEVIGQTSYLVQAKDQNLETTLSERPFILSLDAMRMQQVLYNLLINAIKYTAKGGRIQVTSLWEGATAVIRISDTGIGMTPEVQAQAFQLYYQAPQPGDSRLSLAEKARSKGLGLFIVKMLIEAHNGYVTLESELQRGTTVSIYLPMEPHEHE